MSALASMKLLCCLATKDLTLHRTYLRLMCTKPSCKVSTDANLQEKLVKVAVIGVPNAGKSTFINNLIDHRVCPTSSKVHTTRKASQAICVRQNSQVILFDTPGLVSSKEIKKHRLESSFTSSSRHSIQNANIISVIHDVSNVWTRGELNPSVIAILKEYHKVPSFLVLNKVDLLKSKRVLLDLVQTLTENSLGVRKKEPATKPVVADIVTDNEVPKVQKQIGWSQFRNVFMVSSITGDGLQKVMEFILQFANPHSWEFESNQFSDESSETLINESVRAKLLDFLPQEIPYLLQTEIEYYAERQGTIYASVLVTCPLNRIERLVCGESNGKLKQITERVTSDLVETFSKPISLTIVTRTVKRASK